ncbi:MAG: hypothetical protein ACKOD5_13550 [Chthoniobacterales bacterium]
MTATIDASVTQIPVEDATRFTTLDYAVLSPQPAARRVAFPEARVPVFGVQEKKGRQGCGTLLVDIAGLQVQARFLDGFALQVGQSEEQEHLADAAGNILVAHISDLDGVRLVIHDGDGFPRPPRHLARIGRIIQIESAHIVGGLRRVQDDFLLAQDGGGQAEQREKQQ